ncbi:MAG: uncharacterized membrane protein YbhN (UPF0104 family) [Halioglobus sp.]|jgi:uncharacterized membrane protein YbhN (UPF0104 family)
MFPLRIVLGLIVLIILVRHVDFSAFLSLSKFQIMALCAVIATLMSTACIEAARLRSLTENKYDFSTMTQTIFIAAFITNFTPSNIGGDGYKVFKIGKQRGYSSATALILLERGVGLGVLLLGSITFAFFWGGAWVDEYYTLGTTVDLASYWNSLTQGLLAAVSVIFIVALVFFRRAVRRVASEFVEALIRLRLTALFKVLVITMLFHIVRASSLCAVLAIIGESLDFTQAWVVITFTAVASLVPLSIGALGIREAAFVVALAPFAIAAPEALFVGLVFRAGSILQAAVGGFLTARGYSSAEPQNVEMK